MDDVRLVVEHAAETMPAEIAHHAHALRLDKTLDGMPDVAGGGAGFYGGEAAQHGFLGDFTPSPDLAGARGPPINPAGTAVPGPGHVGAAPFDEIAFPPHPRPRP